MNTKIFISYRRQDTSGYALAIHREIMEKVPSADATIDASFLKPGARWRDEIRKRASSCDIALVIVGRDWLVGRDGERKIDDESDPVRAELELFLSRPEAEIIPIFVDGAKMPSARELPDAVRELHGRHGLEIHHATYGQNIDELIELLTVRATQRGAGPAAGPRPDLPPAGTATSFPARITQQYLEREVPGMGRDRLVALVTELRRRRWTDAEVAEYALRHSPIRPPDGLPTRITLGWLEANVPLLGVGRIHELNAELVRRGWTPEERRTHVFEHRQVDLSLTIPARIQIDWLQRNAPLMTADEQTRLAEVILERGWSLEEVRRYLPFATVE